MRAKINPTGTHVKDGLLKVRLDLYPEPADKTYALHYVDKLDREPTEEELSDPEKVARVPVHRELNPCLCHFITVPEDITGEQLLACIEQLFTPDCLATLDDALVRPDAVHYISPYMKSRPEMAASRIKTADNDALIAAVNNRLNGLEYNGGKGNAETIEPQSIDIGAAAIDRGATTSGSITIIDTNNPANAGGTIDTYQVFANTNMTSSYVATAYLVSGSNYTSRDYESIGTVTSGSVQTFSGLSIDVLTGDYACIAWASGNIEKDETGAGACYVQPMAIPFTNKAFAFVASRAFSCYGTGTESGGVTEKTSAETGAGIEGVSGRGMARGETGSGAESLGPRSFRQPDVGSGIEGALARAAILAGDAGQATEYAHILGLWEVLFSGDAGRGSDLLKGLAVTGGHDTGLRAGPGRVGIPHKEVKL